MPHRVVQRRRPEAGEAVEQAVEGFGGQRVADGLEEAEAADLVRERVDLEGHGEGPDVVGFRGDAYPTPAARATQRSEEHTSELQSLMRNSYAVFCLKKKKKVAI